MSDTPGGRSDAERERTAQFGRQFRQRRSLVFLEIEKTVFGADYGATSWTDRDEAQRLARWLELRSGVRLLEVGAGCGWPGLYLARLTGCAVTLTDLPPEGLGIAALRAEGEGISERCATVVCDGARLPFPDASFEAIVHCDVLC